MNYSLCYSLCYILCCRLGYSLSHNIKDKYSGLFLGRFYFGILYYQGSIVCSSLEIILSVKTKKDLILVVSIRNRHVEKIFFLQIILLYG